MWAPLKELTLCKNLSWVSLFCVRNGVALLYAIPSLSHAVPLVFIHSWKQLLWEWLCKQGQSVQGGSCCDSKGEGVLSHVPSTWTGLSDMICTSHHLGRRMEHETWWHCPLHEVPAWQCPAAGPWWWLTVTLCGLLRPSMQTVSGHLLYQVTLMLRLGIPTALKVLPRHVQDFSSSNTPTCRKLGFRT